MLTCFKKKLANMDDLTDSPRPDRNPSPPPELRENKELDSADKVGQSAFSKHWIFSTLMKLIQEVDKESSKPEADQSELGIDVNEDLQNELCELWDMSMNPDVATFLHEFKAMDILGGVIRKSKAPRVVEICVGILGNMVCIEDVCQSVSNNNILVNLLLSLLDSRDPQTLVETTRLCYVCLCNNTSLPIWLSAIKESTNFQENLKFLFQSSTNVDLLKKTAELLDKLLELDDELCHQWASQEMVQALLEGVQQIGYRHSEALEVYLHIFELLSTTEEGVQALVSDYEQVLIPLRKYLTGVCEYEIVGLDDRERCLCSALAVFNVVFSSSREATTSVNQDEQCMRCLLKILEPLFSRISDLRKKSSETISEEELTSSDSKPLDPDVSSDKVSQENQDENQDVNNKEVNGFVKAPVTDGGNVSTEQIGQGDGNSVSPPSNLLAGENKYLILLYEILQGFLSDIISSLHSAMPQQVTEDSGSVVPLVLKYLNTMCTRHRVKCLINTLEEIKTTEEDIDPIVKLSDLAQSHHLRRLCDIIDNVPSRQYSVPETDTAV